MNYECHIAITTGEHHTRSAHATPRVTRGHGVPPHAAMLSCRSPSVVLIRIVQAARLMICGISAVPPHHHGQSTEHRFGFQIDL